MTRRSGLTALWFSTAITVLAMAPGTAFAEGRAYTFTKVMVPGSAYTHATGINNAGLIVGSYQDASGIVHGFSFDGVTYTTVDFPGSNVHYAIGTGPNGEIVGTHGMAAAGPWHAFIKDANGYTSFDFPGMESDARAVNSAGQIVGVYNAGGITPIHGFLKTGDTYKSIDFPGSQHTAADGINDSGLISGSYQDATGSWGFLAVADSYVPVKYPNSSFTRLVRLNNLGESVGYQEQGGVTHAFLLKGPSFRGFDVDFAGATASGAFANNDTGRVVGVYFAPDCPVGCGFLAVPSAAPPVCDQSVVLTYVPNRLTVRYTIKTSVPTAWALSIIVGGVSYPLVSVNLPAVPLTTFDLPINGVPRLGTVVGLSTLSTPGGGVVCADYGVVNTGF